MEAHPPILLAPDEAHGKTAPQLAACRLVPDASVEARAQHMQFRLAHRALEPAREAVVEQGRVIDTIAIADQRVSEAAEIDETVPIGIVACEARSFEAEHDAHMSERDFSREPREATAFDEAGAGQAEVFIDDNDLLRRPAERGGPADQGILELRRFAIVLDLRGGGLAKIDVSCSAQMRGADLCDVTHRSPPFDWVSRRLGR